ncbi:MAG: hypothetical protein R6W93_12555 [Candidatus Limnocylindrales bacterium]
MNDELFQRTVGSWLRDEDPAPPDPIGSARQVAARLPKVRQQSRWWPLPLLRPTPAPSPAIPGSDPRASPIPATNGHSPTLTGRTQTMLSPSNVIVAGALVFAVGGAFLIARPLGPSEAEMPAVTADESMTAPVEFTATWVYGPQRRAATDDSLQESLGEGDGVVNATGAVFRPVVTETSDPRFDGEVTFIENTDTYGGFTVQKAAWRIETADGAWWSEPTLAIDYFDGAPPSTTTVLRGEGGYEGLTAIATIEGQGAGMEVRGVVLDGDLPPDPDALGKE